MGENTGATRTRTPGKAAGTPTGATTTPSLSRKPSSASTTGKQQKSILGFFSKAASKDKDAATIATSTPTSQIPSSPCLRETTTKSNTLQLNKRPSKNITPVPSSDALEPSSSQENIDSATTVKVPENDAVLPSFITLADTSIKHADSSKPTVMGSSPSRKAKKSVNYAESSDDDDEDVFVAMKAARSRRRKPRQSRVADDDDDDDVYEESKEPEVAEEDGELAELLGFVECIWVPRLTLYR